MSNFVHLHTHSEYSTLDGMGKIQELFETAQALGQKALAITDHGTASGIYEAQQIADKLGMKAILGVEFYYEREGDGKNGHLLVLAKNNKGLEHLLRLQKYSYQNVNRKPRIDWDILKHYNEGLLTTSTCLGSAFNQLILQGDILGATEWARKFKQTFGEDFYIELQPNQIPEQHIVNETSLRIARQLNIPIVATNDVHYVQENDCFPHEVLLAMQTKKKMSDEKRFKFSTDDFWLKSEQEMYDTFHGLPTDVVKEAIENTSIIADKCNARIEKGNYLPSFYDVPDGKTERELLVEHTIKGVREKGFSRNKEFMKDVQNEIDVIDRNGYSGYFLIVQDYVVSARKRHEIVGDGRGSGAGSKVAYVTDITKIPPHEFDLLFERFMADGRQPDFDVDFSDQQAVFEDLQRKYGVENVARIVAFGRMTPRSVVRKVLNTFEHDMHEISQITKLIDNIKHKTLAMAYKDSPKLLDYKKKYPIEWNVIERLENVISHESKHAGGVIIYHDLEKYVPLKWDKDEKIYVARWDKYMLESLGHYKFDVLGLETLPVVYNTLKSIQNITGKSVDLHTIDYNDKNVYDMLCSGDVSGVFQIAGQSGKVMEQQPRNFKDLIAINALIRPGVGDWNEYIARRQGKEWNVYQPRMPYMEETQGTMTYQEQFLLDAHILAGWDIAYADKHIRKNKDIRNDETIRNQFIKDSTRNGHDKSTIEEIWKEIEDAVDGGYSFNKSHSASYAMLSFQTAWLKYYYPEHFYASLMSSEKTDGDGQDAIAGYVAEIKRRGIKLLPPSINHSNDNYNVTNRGITYRITTIKHVGESAIQSIIDMRPIHSFHDFLDRRDTSTIKKNVIVNLIKAGCFDEFGEKREDLLWTFDMHNRTKTQIKENVQCPRYTVDDLTYMEWEKEVLGMYLSQHPMERFGFKPLEEYKDKENCIQGGEVIDVFKLKDKNRNDMAFVTINTLYGNIKLLLFSSTWSRTQIQKDLQVGNLVLVKGRRSGKDVIVNETEVLT